jgi:protein phosphatase
LSNPVSPEEIGTVVKSLPPKEAASFLIELANLRGGPDNITALVVQAEEGTPAGQQQLPVKRLKHSGTRMLKKIPWPLPVLGLGFLLALGMVGLSAAGVHGLLPLLLLAILTIVAGFVGLVLHSRKEVEVQEEPAHEAPRVLNIYREYSCRIERPLLDKLLKLDSQLSEHLQSKPSVVDWETYRTYRASCEQLIGTGDLVAAFREECRAVAILAKVINSQREKNENFKPKWENPWTT